MLWTACSHNLTSHHSSPKSTANSGRSSYSCCIYFMMILLGSEFHCVFIGFVLLLYDDVCVALLNVLLLSEVFHSFDRMFFVTFDGVCLFVCVRVYNHTDRKRKL